MEHIGRALKSPGNHPAEYQALHVIGSVNDVLAARGLSVRDASATSFDGQTVSISVYSSAVGAIIRQNKDEILNQTNALLKQRYGKGGVTNLRIRV